MHWASFYAGQSAGRRYCKSTTRREMTVDEVRAAAHEATMHEIRTRAAREGQWQRRQREQRVMTRDEVSAQHEARYHRRLAFLEGAKHIRDVYGLRRESAHLAADKHEAARRFPMPKVIKPLVLTLAQGPETPGWGVAWRFVSGKFESQDVRDGVAPHEERWVVRGQLPAAWIEQLMDLKRNPTTEEDGE